MKFALVLCVGLVALNGLAAVNEHTRAHRLSSQLREEQSRTATLRQQRDEYGHKWEAAEGDLATARLQLIARAAPARRCNVSLRAIKLMNGVTSVLYQSPTASPTQTLRAAIGPNVFIEATAVACQ